MIDQENPQEDSTEGQAGEMDEAQAPAQVDPNQPVESQNLVTMFQADESKRTWLEDMAKKLCKRINDDDESREEWKRDRADEIELYAGISKAMRMSQGGGNSPHDPVLTRVLLQLWSRGWDQICPAKGTLMQVHANGPQDEEAAQRREEYMNWQLRHKIPNWIMGHAEAYLSFLLAGSVFREKFWNPTLRTTEMETVSADDIIVPWTRKDIDPLMKRVPRVTRVLHLYKWEIEGLVDDGAFDPMYGEKIFDSSSNSGSSNQEPSVIMDANRKIEKIEMPETTLSQGDDKDLKPRDIYRCHTWVSLPDDKRMRPVTFTIDRQSKLPLSLVIREAEDPFDRRRYESQKQEWTLKAQNIVAQYQMQLQQGIPAQKPVPPPEPAPPKTRTLFNVVHYRLFTNPAGFYGIGVGYLLKNANLLVNKLEAEYLTSARLANSNQGWLPKGTLAKRGPVDVEIGKYHETELEAEQMSGIRPIQFNPPADGLWKFIEKVRNDCGTLIADVDTMSGEAGPTNETKAAAQQRMYNATALVSNVVRLYNEPLKEEIKLIAHDNRFFMDDSEFYWVTSPTHQAPGGQQTETKQAFRSDFADEFDFTFTSDQRLQSQPERIQVLTNVLTQLMQVPLTKDPARGLPLFYVALQKLFRALDMPEFEQALGPPPPPPGAPQPPQPMNQIDETADFLQGKDHPVLPTDDHQSHLMKIDDFESSSFAMEMEPAAKQLLDRHKQAHVGELYKQQAHLHQQGQDAIGFGQVQRGMAGGPGNPGFPGASPPPPPPPSGAAPTGMPVGGQPQ